MTYVHEKRHVNARKLSEETPGTCTRCSVRNISRNTTFLYVTHVHMSCDSGQRHVNARKKTKKKRMQGKKPKKGKKPAQQSTENTASKTAAALAHESRSQLCCFPVWMPKEKKRTNRRSASVWVTITILWVCGVNFKKKILKEMHKKYKRNMKAIMSRIRMRR